MLVCSTFPGTPVKATGLGHVAADAVLVGSVRAAMARVVAPRATSGRKAWRTRGR
jgi:hypothetical protein